MTDQRDIALDVRTHREGEVMATPEQRVERGSRGVYWLRPVGGGEEWPAPREFVQILKRASQQ